MVKCGFGGGSGSGSTELQNVTAVLSVLNIGWMVKKVWSTHSFAILG